jgi:hypothetical protein
MGRDVSETGSCISASDGSQKGICFIVNPAAGSQDAAGLAPAFLSCWLGSAGNAMSGFCGAAAMFTKKLSVRFRMGSASSIKLLRDQIVNFTRARLAAFFAQNIQQRIHEP